MKLKKRQLSRSSFIPSATPRISQHPSCLTPIATKAELDLTTSAAFQVDTIYINIEIFLGKQTGMPCFNTLISLFIQVTDCSRIYLRSL